VSLIPLTDRERKQSVGVDSGNFEWQSHQDSNLDLRFRKPEFYLWSSLLSEGSERRRVLGLSEYFLEDFDEGVMKIMYLI